MKSLVLSIIVLFVTAAGFSGTYLTDTIEYSAGTGSKSATIVIDFDYESYFVFEYKWDDLSVTGDEDATGWDALAALNAGELNVDYTDYGAPWGVFVSDFDYSGGVEYDYGAAANVSWAYYGSTDNATWSGNPGVSARVLSDGSFDSWVWSNYPVDWSAPIRMPGQAPVPEPATMGLLALGGLLIRRKK